MGKCAEFIRGTAEPGLRAAELARSVRFRQGTGTGLRDDRLIHSRIHGEFRGTQTWGAPLSGTHVWDQVILV